MAGAAHAQSDHVDRFTPLVYEDAKGSHLRYRLFAPEPRNASKRYPLVIYLHGSGGRGTDNVKQLTGGNVWATGLFSSPEVQERYPSFVLVPQTNRAVTEGWGGFERHPGGRRTLRPEPAGEPIDHLVALIDALSDDYPIDSRRIYVAGQSMGGAGAWALVTRYPGRFAAVVPVCGAGDPKQAGRIRAPAWVFQGADDRTVPPIRSREMVEALRAAGAEARYTEYPGVGHDSYEKAFTDPELVEWLFAQRGPAVE